MHPAHTQSYPVRSERITSPVEHRYNFIQKALSVYGYKTLKSIRTHVKRAWGSSRIPRLPERAGQPLPQNRGVQGRLAPYTPLHKTQTWNNHRISGMYNMFVVLTLVTHWTPRHSLVQRVKTPCVQQDTALPSLQCMMPPRVWPRDPHTWDVFPSSLPGSVSSVTPSESLSRSLSEAPSAGVVFLVLSTSAAACETSHAHTGELCEPCEICYLRHVVVVVVVWAR